MTTPTQPAQAFSAQAVKWTNTTLVRKEDSNFAVNGARVAARAAIDTTLVVAALVETVVNAILLVPAAAVSLVKEGAFTSMKERTVSSLNASKDAAKGIFGYGQVAGDDKNVGTTSKRREGYKGYIDDAKRLAQTTLTKATTIGGNAVSKAKAGVSCAASHVAAHKYSYIGGAVLAAGIALGLDHKWGNQYGSKAYATVGNVMTSAWGKVPNLRGSATSTNTQNTNLKPADRVVPGTLA